MKRKFWIRWGVMELIWGHLQRRTFVLAMLSRQVLLTHLSLNIYKISNSCVTNSERARHAVNGHSGIWPALTRHWVTSLSCYWPNNSWKAMRYLFPAVWERERKKHTWSCETDFRHFIRKTCLYISNVWSRWSVRMSYRPVEMWWHTRRNQILSFGETDESI